METILGSAIRQVRKRAGLTRSELSKRAGVSRSAITKNETGLAKPMLDTAKQWIATRGFDLKIELAGTSLPRETPVDAALERTAMHRLHTSNSFTGLALQLRRAQGFIALRNQSFQP